jgi:hypothetical protein
MAALFNQAAANKGQISLPVNRREFTQGIQD